MHHLGQGPPAVAFQEHVPAEVFFQARARRRGRWGPAASAAKCFRSSDRIAGWLWRTWRMSTKQWSWLNSFLLL